MLHSNKKINFFITSNLFPSLSVTGTSCALLCKHCEGKLLEALVPATTCEELEKKALMLHKQGAVGLLLTGGCDKRGRVPVNSLIPAIKRLKEKTELLLIAQTGFISREEAAAFHATQFQKMDANKDGRLNREESMAMMKGMHEGGCCGMNMMDGDGMMGADGMMNMMGCEGMRRDQD